jgi:hypothetical protein
MRLVCRTARRVSSPTWQLPPWPNTSPHSPRIAALRAVRKAINENLPDGYEEGIQFGMIGWYVPLSRYPAGYGENPKVPLPLVCLGLQKSGMVLHFL